MALLTPKELCAHLKISRSSLHRLRKRGLPALGNGRLTRFDQDKVLRWYDQYSHQDNAATTLLPPGIYQCPTCGFQGTTDKAFAPTQVAPCPKCGTRARPIRVDGPAV